MTPSNFDHNEQLIAVDNAPERRRRFSFLGKKAGNAVMTQSVTMENYTDLEAENGLFGLETDLQHYGELWSAHSNTVRSFVDNQENRELIRGIIVDADPEGGRQTRRTALKLQARDFEPIASVFVTAGRVESFSTRSIVDQLADSGAQDLVKEAREFQADRKRVDYKLQHLFEGLEVTGRSLELKRRLEDLKAKSKATYKPIIKQERNMISTLERSLGDPATSLLVLDTFVGTEGSESTAEKTFATFLANNMLAENGNSILATAIRNIEAAGANGQLTGRYIEERLRENEGNNMLAFFAEALTSSNIETSFVDFMVNNRDSWPSELGEAYEAFIDDIAGKYRAAVQRLSNRVVKKAWLHPDLGTYEDTLDRLFKQMHNGVTYAKSIAKPTRKTIGRRIKAAPSDFINAESTEQIKQPLKLVRLVRTREGLVINEFSEDGIRSLLDKSQQDPEYINDLQKVIERLQIDPGGSGVRSLLSPGKLALNDKRVHLYRASPSHMTGTSFASKRIKRSRVVFTVTNGHLAVLAVPKDHEDYEQLIHTF